MKKIEIVNNVEIEVVSHEDTFLVSNKEVAQAFGVGEAAIRNHKARSEFVEGKHWVSQLVTSELENGKSNVQTKTMWTKRGIIRLGFKLQETEFTIAFRDWAEDYIINGGEKPKELTYEQIMEQALTMASEKVKALQGANDLLVNKNQMLYETVVEIKDEVQARDEIIEHITDRSKSETISTWAKMIYDLHGISIGRNRLFRILRELGYLLRRNEPKQIYVEQRLFTVKDSSYQHPNTGERIFDTTTLVTYKGIEKLTDKVLDHIREEEGRL